MKKLLVFLFVSVLTTTSFGDIYVAPTGNDSNDGSVSAPFATLEKARDTLRQQKKEGTLSQPTTVWLHGGIYQLPGGFTLDAQDAGTEKAPIVWRAVPNDKQKPILVGGRTVSNFVPSKLKEGVYQADLSKTPLASVVFKQLIFDGKRQILARYPNFDPENPYGGGWAYADGKPIPMYQNVPDEPSNTFVLKEQDVRNWAKPQEMQVMVFARYNWWNNIVGVKTFDKEARRITLSGNASYPIRPGDRYYLQNAIEELDSPGEWYLDKETKTLYFLPPKPLEGKEVVVPTCRGIFNCTKTSDLAIRDLTFECCEGTAVNVNESSRIRLIGCTVRNVGDYNGSGIGISGGRKNSVVGCDIHDTGSSGISVGGGDQKTLTPAEHSVVNCYIHHIGIYYKQGVGVSVHGVGNRVANCLIHDGPRFAIQYGGNNHVFEWNEMRHMNLETEDTGATYTGGRNWINGRGCVIRHNFIHDMLGYGKDARGVWQSPHFAWGVYLDDNAGGCDVIGNIIVRCPRALIHLHNGRDNLVENNIFVDATLQQMEFSGWNTKHRYWIDHSPTMFETYDKFKNEPAWQGMRNMQLDPRNAVLPDDTIMSGNQFHRNIFSYRDPKAKYVRCNNFNFEHNEIDSNLIWHYGLPIETGVLTPGRSIGENLSVNGGFEVAEPGKLPRNWNWQCFPSPQTTWGVVEEGTEGKQAFRLDANHVKEKPRDNTPIICSNPMKLKPGQSYRLSAKMKAGNLPKGTETMRADLYLHHWSPKTPYWGGGQGSAPIGTEWTEVERAIRVPAPGEPGYHDQVDSIKISIGNPNDAGSLFVDDVKLYETESIDEWTSWQGKGMDKNSVIADPLFVGNEANRQDPKRARAADFVPGKDSPAWKLGFKPIPVEKIGLFESEYRASWPIVESEGAREKPLK